jgi:hypothetical protein
MEKEQVLRNEVDATRIREAIRVLKEARVFDHLRKHTNDIALREYQSLQGSGLKHIGSIIIIDYLENFCDIQVDNRAALKSNYGVK